MSRSSLTEQGDIAKNCISTDTLQTRDELSDLIFALNYVLALLLLNPILHISCSHLSFSSNVKCRTRARLDSVTILIKIDKKFVLDQADTVFFQNHFIQSHSKSFGLEIYPLNLTWIVTIVVDSVVVCNSK